MATKVTVPQETLTCEFEPKPHKWKRDAGKRGRKPRFCPRHIPAITVSVSAPATAKELYCEIGKHKWIREPTRGRVPTSCPEHRVAQTIVSAPRTESGMVKMHCEAGNHDWERAPQRGRKPVNCPEHSVPAPRSVGVKVVEGSQSGEAPRKPGRPKLYQSDEEKEAAQLERSRQRVNDLEGRLKERGTHISQQAPYILYKKVKEIPSRTKGRPPTTEWEKVTEHSPLAQAQYVNAHEKDFQDGLYRYERNGKVIVL